MRWTTYTAQIRIHEILDNKVAELDGRTAPTPARSPPAPVTCC